MNVLITDKETLLYPHKAHESASELRASETSPFSPIEPSPGPNGSPMSADKPSLWKRVASLRLIPLDPLELSEEDPQYCNRSRLLWPQRRVFEVKTAAVKIPAVQAPEKLASIQNRVFEVKTAAVEIPAVQVPEKPASIQRYLHFSDNIVRTTEVMMFRGAIGIMFEGPTSFLTAAPYGANGALLLMPYSGAKPGAVVKLSSREIGTAESLALNSTALAINEGINPGEGTFSNYLGSIVIATWLAQIGSAIQGLAIPPAMWATTIQHPDITSEAQKSVGIAPPTTQEGCVVKFLDNCQTFSTMSLEKQQLLNTDAVQAMALMMCMLVNVDASGENVLIQPDQRHSQSDKLIPIDLTILPKPVGEGVNIGIKACWKNLHQLNEPVSEKNQLFIRDPRTGQVLETMLQQLKKQKINNAVTFDPVRVLIHKIAVQLVRTGIEKGLTPRDICQCFLYREEFTTNAVAWIYQHLSEPKESASQFAVESLCELFITCYQETLEQNLPQKQPREEASYAELLLAAKAKADSRLQKN